MSVLTYAVPIAVGVLGWFGAQVVGKRILEIREKRLEALKAVAMYGFVGEHASEERVKTAEAVLIEVGAALVAYAREQSWPTQQYCRLFKYDLQMAGSALHGLASMAGDGRYGNEARENNVNLVYLCLHAASHVPPEQLERVKNELKKAKGIEFRD